jgi:hypothetical protein
LRGLPSLTVLFQRTLFAAETSPGEPVIVAIPEQATRSYVISPVAIAFDLRRRFSTIIRDAWSDLFLVPVSSNSMSTTNVFSAIGERFELAESATQRQSIGCCST